MTGLLDAVLGAHGGLDRWRQFDTIEATIVTGGKLWEIKGGPPLSYGPSSPSST
jgi:hypothetical protein